MPFRLLARHRAVPDAARAAPRRARRRPQLTPSAAERPAPAREDGGAGDHSPRGARRRARLRRRARAARRSPRSGARAPGLRVRAARERRCAAPRLGWALVDGRAARRRRGGDRRASRRAAGRRSAPPPCSASPSRKTSRSSTAPTPTIPWLAVCLPSRWAPEDKVGRHFAEVHAPVADNALLVAAGDSARPPRHRQRALGAVRLDDLGRSAPAPASGARPGRLARGRRCRRARRARLLAQRAPDLHPDARHAARRCSRSASPASRSTPRCARATTRRRLHDALASMSAGGARLPRPRRRVRERLLDWPWRRAHRGAAAGGVKTRADPSPAGIERDADGMPRSPDFGDVYHPRSGALGPGAPRLPRRQRPAGALARPRALRRSSRPASASATTSSRPGQPGATIRSAAGGCTSSRSRPRPLQRGRPRAPRARRRPWRRSPPSSPRRWPPLTCNLHRLAFDDGRRRAAAGLRRRRAPGCRSSSPASTRSSSTASPRRAIRAMWEPRLFKAMARLAAPGATAATWTAARAGARRPDAAPASRSELAPAAAASATSRVARFAPRFTPRPAPRRRRRSSRRSRAAGGEPPVVIVGGGLAGCALACGAGRARPRVAAVRAPPRLARRGLGQCRPASSTASSIAHDGRHARFHRAAAFAARRRGRGGDRAARRARQRRRPAAPRAGDRRSRRDCRRCIDALGLPADYVRRLDARRASATRRRRASPRRPGTSRGGGWVEPRGLARAALAPARRRSALSHSAARSRRCAASRRVAAARRAPARVVAAAETVVLCQRRRRARLLGGASWPVERQPRPDQRPRRRRLAGGRGARACRSPAPATLLPPIDGTVWFGATAQTGRRRSRRCAPTTTAPTSSASRAWSAAAPTSHATRRRSPAASAFAGRAAIGCRSSAPCRCG